MRKDRFSARTLELFRASGLPRTLSVRAATADQPAEILLYDEIGFWGVTAKDFQSALAAAGAGPLTVRINSPGGDVFDGLAMYNALLSRGDVTTVVDGLAASAASFIALAGTSVQMAESSMMMIHNAWGVAIGNKNDMRSTANILDKIDGQLGGIYAAKTGQSTDDVAAAMNAETWMTAQEATDAGYCDVVIAAPSAEGRAAAKAVAAYTVRASLRDAHEKPAPVEPMAEVVEQPEIAQPDPAEIKRISTRLRIAVAE